ncbi:hypothetical protein [Bacillus cereus]|uniref:hypothetical protein n=1 Tax=Bacillus cereus TaxID=1396 RepID=UPI000BFC9CB5|nr:hypothetical protein [Bacillus cereus]PGY17732.1 hypothetical protein COE23_05840 [Bacillus cereus]
MNTKITVTFEQAIQAIKEADFLVGKAYEYSDLKKVLKNKFPQINDNQVSGLVTRLTKSEKNVIFTVYKESGSRNKYIYAPNLCPEIITKKYELTNIFINEEGIKLFRIRALKDLNQGKVKVGDLGGFVESEANLSHEGNAWIYDDAQVKKNARVYDDARVHGNAKVHGNAVVYDDAAVGGNALVCIDAKVYGNAVVYGDAEVFGNARVYDSAQVFGFSKISGQIYGDAKVYGNTRVRGNTQVYDNARVFGSSNFLGNVKVYENAVVYGDVGAMGNVKIYGNAVVCGAGMPFCSNVKIFDDVEIYGNAIIHNTSDGSEGDTGSDYIEIKHNAKIYGCAHIMGHSITIQDDVQVYGFVSIYSDVSLTGDREIYENAHIGVLPKKRTFVEYRF